MSPSRRILEYLESASWIRKMFEEGNRRKEKYGKDKVFDYSLGNPNMEPPPKFKKILYDLISDDSPGQHAYMANAGYVETRRAVANFLNKCNKPRFTADDVVMTVGAGGAMNVIIKTILNPGEEVIIPSPYFVEYIFYVHNHQGVPKIVRTKQDFSLDFDAISEAINAKTRAVLINYPNNPTGRVCREDELETLGQLLSHHSEKLGQPIYLISDEPYREIVYDGVKVPCVMNMYNETFIATSFSKDFSLPGERIGYAAANPNMSDKEVIMEGLILCNRILGYINAPALMQRAIAFLLEEVVDVSMYKRKRDALCEGLASFGYDFIKPQGTFYFFPRSPIEDDVAFVNLLQEENILTVPGSGFGGAGHFRIAYCVSDELIERSLPGFERAMKKCRT